MADSDIHVPAAKPEEPENAEAMRFMMAHYYLACEGTPSTGTHRDPEALAALFVDDGAWEISGNRNVGRGDRQDRTTAPDDRVVRAFPGESSRVERRRCRASAVQGFCARSLDATLAGNVVDRPLYYRRRADRGWLFHLAGWEYPEDLVSDDDVAAMIGHDDAV